MHNVLRSRALARRTALLCSVSIVIAGNLGRAFGGVIDYPDGSNNASPIVLTDNSTQLQVLTGSATQAGAISESGGSYGQEKIGTGTLTLNANNSYSGGTTLSAGILQIATDASLGASSGPLTFNGGTLRFGTSYGLFSPFSFGSSRAIVINAGGPRSIRMVI